MLAMNTDITNEVEQKREKVIEVLTQRGIKYKICNKPHLIGLIKISRPRYYFNILDNSWFVFNQNGMNSYRSRGIEDFIDKYFNSTPVNETRMIQNQIRYKKDTISKLQEKIDSLNLEIDELTKKAHNKL